MQLKKQEEANIAVMEGFFNAQIAEAAQKKPKKAAAKKVEPDDTRIVLTIPYSEYLEEEGNAERILIRHGIYRKEQKAPLEKRIIYLKKRPQRLTYYIAKKKKVKEIMLGNGPFDQEISIELDLTEPVIPEKEEEKEPLPIAEETKEPEIPETREDPEAESFEFSIELPKEPESEPVSESEEPETEKTEIPDASPEAEPNEEPEKPEEFSILPQENEPFSVITPLESVISEIKEESSVSKAEEIFIPAEEEKKEEPVIIEPIGSSFSFSLMIDSKETDDSGFYSLDDDERRLYDPELIKEQREYEKMMKKNTKSRSKESERAVLLIIALVIALSVVVLLTFSVSGIHAVGETPLMSIKNALLEYLRSLFLR